MSSNGQRVRLGIVGAGNMANNHLKGWATMDDVQVIAVCDVVEDRARSRAEPLGASAYTDPDRMLGESALDAVYILLPPFDHGAAERAALKYRVPFFVEKPVGVDIQFCKEIAAGVREQGLLTGVGYMNRYRQGVQRAKAVFQQDPPVIAHGGWINGAPQTREEYGAWTWWSDKSKSGGQLVEQTTHTVDLVRYLMGDVVEVFAHGVTPRTFNKQVPPAYSIEDAMVVSLRFAGGAVATLYNTCASNAGGGVSLTVFAPQHAAYFTGWDHALRLVTQAPDSGRAGRSEESIAGEPDIFAVEDRQFINALKTGDQSLVLADYPDGVKTAEVTIAANQTLATGRPMYLA